MAEHRIPSARRKFLQKGRPARRARLADGVTATNFISTKNTSARRFDSGTFGNEAYSVHRNGNDKLILLR